MKASDKAPLPVHCSRCGDLHLPRGKPICFDCEKGEYDALRYLHTISKPEGRIYRPPEDIRTKTDERR